MPVSRSPPPLTGISPRAYLVAETEARLDQAMTIRVLDPTNEAEPPMGQAAPRLLSLRGTTVGFISNGKEGAKEYFAHLGRMLQQEHGVARIVHRVKSNYSAPADKHIVDEIRQWQAVVTGIGD